MTGSGLDAQVGVAAETTWGTPVTPTRFLEFISETLKQEPTWLEPTGLRAGQKYKRVARARRSKFTVNGDLTLEHATKGMGLLWKHALGSPVTAPSVIVAGALEQNHVPGPTRGLGLTVQVGRPEPDTGTVRPHTYEGCKITGWEFSVKDGEIPQLKLMFDGQQELTGTALAAASYLTGATVFDFSQAVLRLGGVATTTAGETTVAGGIVVATVIRDMTVSGESPKDYERFGLGNAGLKREPLENATPTITGSLSAEFSKVELYDVFTAGTTICIQLTLTGAQIAATAENFKLELTMPACKLKAAAPTVDGPGIVQMSTSFEAYSDETTNPPIQVRIVSDEAAL